jgi:two-component system, OmpR family, sensor kinase
MRLRGWIDAVFGRRILVRIWTRGVLLFAAILAALTIARFVLPGHDPLFMTRGRPQLAMRLVTERILARSRDGDRAALERDLRALSRDTQLSITAYAPDGSLLATIAHPPLAAPGRDAIAALSPAESFREIDAEWVSARYLTGAFDDDGHLAAYAVAVLRWPARLTLHLSMIFLTAAVLALVFVAVPLSRSIARPIERLGRLARELGAGNLAVRATTERRDEIGDLARSFNEMAAQIQRLRATERELLAGVSHELRTPLARISVVLDLAADADPERARRYLREIATDVAELEQLLEEIIATTRLEIDPARWVEASPPLQRRAVELAALIEASTGRFRERSPSRAIHAHVSDQPLTVDADPVLLRRVLDNLLDNARKYSPDDEPILIEVSREGEGEGAVARVEVVDRGAGIDPADHPRLFTPFFRADRSRTRSTGGVGLGLALARRIVEAHGGAIGHAPAPERGSRFWFTLPLASTTA